MLQGAQRYPSQCDVTEQKPHPCKRPKDGGVPASRVGASVGQKLGARPGSVASSEVPPLRKQRAKMGHPQMATTCTFPGLYCLRKVGHPPMSTNNNLRPRHLPTWVTITLIFGFAVAGAAVEEHFQPVVGWLAVAEYILLQFGAIVFSLRPAWGRRAFWLAASILLGLHFLAGLLLVFLFPTWLSILRSFLTVIFVSDGLLTMSILWRITVAHGRKSL